MLLEVQMRSSSILQVPFLSVYENSESSWGGTRECKAVRRVEEVHGVVDGQGLAGLTAVVACTALPTPAIHSHTLR